MVRVTSRTPDDVFAVIELVETPGTSHRLREPHDNRFGKSIVRVIGDPAAGAYFVAALQDVEWQCGYPVHRDAASREERAPAPMRERDDLRSRIQLRGSDGVDRDRLEASVVGIRAQQHHARILSGVPRLVYQVGRERFIICVERS